MHRIITQLQLKFGEFITNTEAAIAPSPLLVVVNHDHPRLTFLSTKNSKILIKLLIFNIFLQNFFCLYSRFNKLSDGIFLANALLLYFELSTSKKHLKNWLVKNYRIFTSDACQTMK